MQLYLTVLFADITNSARLYETQGDAQAHRLIAGFLLSMKTVIEEKNGTLLRTVGDAALASFDRTDQAFQAAVDMQRAHQFSPLQLRVGFHFGEVIPDEGDVYGSAVNIAARVASFAKADEVYTTDDAVEHLSPELKEQTTFLDNIDFKGIDKLMPVYRINWADEQANTEIFTNLSHSTKYQTNALLELRSGAHRVRIDPENPVVNLGRALENDVVVDHHSTSRNHATIELVRGRYMLRDTSTNGSYVVREGRAAEFVRRDEIPLEESGIIGLGWSPKESDSEKIEFHMALRDLEK